MKIDALTVIQSNYQVDRIGTGDLKKSTDPYPYMSEIEFQSCMRVGKASSKVEACSCIQIHPYTA
ncbi:hypothetical protein PKF022_03260 [Polynucleobacter sp. KF022]|nr:hypothetical protein PKF022_03260 [Polynucleobacter sp. KF022]